MRTEIAFSSLSLCSKFYILPQISPKESLLALIIGNINFLATREAGKMRISIYCVLQEARISLCIKGIKKNGYCISQASML